MKKIFVILVGLVFVGVGIFMIVRGNDLKKKCTATAKGKVVEIVEEESSSSDDAGTSYVYYPIVEYKAGGKTVHKKGALGSNPSKYTENQTVDILYDPKNVETFYIKGEGTGNLFGFIFIGMGAAVAVVGLLGKVQ